MYVCTDIYVWVACGDQKRALDPMKLELQADEQPDMGTKN